MGEDETAIEVLFAETHEKEDTAPVTKLCFILTILVAFTGCANLLPKKKNVPESIEKAELPVAHIPRKVGRIVLVNEEARFVLIETIPGFSPNVGSFLGTKDEYGNMSSLRVGGERKRPFFVGEIQDEIPPVGAEVFQ